MYSKVLGLALSKALGFVVIEAERKLFHCLGNGKSKAESIQAR